jgi:histidine triad (HIT) family protein
MATIFSKIIAGEIPCYKVAETKDFLAFLDVRPLTAGHTLVIPKQEVDYIFDAADEQYAGLFLFAKIVARAIKSTIPCTKVGVAVIGLEVPHAHIHLVPMNAIGDLNFEKERSVFTSDQFREIADKIARSI